MGHSWREMNLIRSAAHDRRIARLQRLRQRLYDIPLSKFTAGELMSLFRIVDVFDEPTDRDIALLERKLRQLKKKTPLARKE